MASASRSTKKTPARAPRAKAAAKPRRPAAGRISASAARETPAAARPRRAVFIDVENTSSEAELLRVLDELVIERGTTEVTAVGNWRVVGQQLGRALAQYGAQLVHSAPAPRVPDWSDLWIAVCAGMWLGRAAPGDRIDIVSHDRAFDAVGDAAARLGVVFRRITYRPSAAAAEATTTASEGESRSGGRRRRRRRRGGTRSNRAAGTGSVSRESASSGAPAPLAQPAAHRATLDEPHAASQDHIRAAIARLTTADPTRGVTLDALTLALKAEGFQRPPGSPRLMTRLRRLKDVEVLPNGRVRLAGGAAEVATAVLEASHALPDEYASETTGAEGAADGVATGSAPKRRRRGGRRGGRRRGGRRRTAGAPTAGSAE